MATASTTKQCTEVVLLRPGVDPETFTLPESATLGDLLREAGAAARSPNILIDGRPIEEAMILKTGSTIMILPEPDPAPPTKDWRRTVGMFADDPDFEEMVQAGRAIREADRKATLEQLDAEQEGS